MTGTPTTSPRTSAAARSRALAVTARRALLRWPRLDQRALARCAGDAACIASLVARRTNLPPETIRAILVSPETEVEREFWFG
jgi:hypothetical protein